MSFMIVGGEEVPDFIPQPNNEDPYVMMFDDVIAYIIANNNNIPIARPVTDDPDEGFRLPKMLRPIRSLLGTFIFNNLRDAELTTVIKCTIADIYLKKDSNFYKEEIGDMGESLGSIANAYNLRKKSIQM